MEIEFAVDLPKSPEDRARFATLQIHPISAREEVLKVRLEEADPSQGSPFFHNITTLGVSCLNVVETARDHIDSSRRESLGAVEKTEHKESKYFSDKTARAAAVLKGVATTMTGRPSGFDAQ